MARKLRGFERVLDAPSLFAVAYVISSVRRRRMPEAALDAHVG